MAGIVKLYSDNLIFCVTHKFATNVMRTWNERTAKKSTQGNAL